MALLKQSATYTRMFFMVDSTDHVSGKTGLTVAVVLSKAGAAFAVAGGVVTEVANGWYKIALTTADTNTLGDLAFRCTATGADPTDFVDQVVAVNPLDANFGLANLDVNVASRATPGNVWEELRSVHNTPGSFGEGVASVTGAVGSVVADVGITQAGADKVWASASRSLTSFGTLVSDIAAAVWAAATRTLTGFGTLVTSIWSEALPGTYGAGTAGNILPGRAAPGAEMTLSATERNNVADALLKRDLSLVTGEAARSPLNALRALRNKVSISGGTMTVTKEDDTTAAWTASVTTDALADPITAVDPT